MATLFWVGGTGSWDNTTAHFATSTGGTATVASPASGDTITFDGLSGGGTVTITAATVPATGTIASWTSGGHTGTINTNGKTVLVSGVMSISGGSTRTVTLGASAITCGTWTATTTTGLTFNANTSTITQNGAGTTFNGGGKTYNSVSLTGSGNQQVTGANTFTNFTRTGTAAKTDGLFVNTTQIVNTSLTLTGNTAVNRIVVQPSSLGTAMTFALGALGTATVSNVDFADITMTGTNIPVTGTSLGDCGNNTGITTDPPTTQSWANTTGGNWSTAANWTSRVPLPQDTVVINKAFSATQTITADMIRLGSSINLTGSTGSPTLALSSTGALSVYGSLTLISSMTLSGSTTLNFSGRSGTMVLTSAGHSFANPINILPAPANLQLADDLVSTSTFAVGTGFLEGGFDANGHNQTCTTFTGSFGTTVIHGPTLTLTSVAATTIYNMSSFCNVTATSTIIVVGGAATTNNRTFTTAASYNFGTLQYTTAGSTGSLILAGSNNTFNSWVFSDATNARAILLTPGTTQTINSGRGLDTIKGTSGKLTTFTTGGAAATIAVTADLVSVDFVSLTSIPASGNVPFYAGANSTDGTGNTNWIFTTPPKASGGNLSTMGVG